MMPEPALQSRHAIDLAAKEFADVRRDLDLEVRADTVNDEARTVEFSFASETPVDRWFGREILDLSKDACLLDRLNGGGACLMDHNWRDQVGVVTKAWIDGPAKKARCLVKFSRGARGKEVFDDIKDGIRRLVSVGYVVRKMVLQSVEGDVETHRVTEWEPFEVSIVAVPADPSVGVGRSKSQESTREPAAPAAPAQVIDFAAERQRVKDINAAATALAARHKQHEAALYALARKCSETGDTVAAFNQAVLNDVLATKGDFAPVRQEKDELGLSRKEQGRYSLFRALHRKANGLPLDGLEKEASDAEAKRLGREPEGFMVPAEVFTFARNHVSQMSPAVRELVGTLLGRDLSAGVPNSGGYLIGETIDTANMVELLRNQSHVMSLGARTLTGLVGNITIPRVLTGSTVYWVTENGQITGSTPTFGQIGMKPRRIGATGVLGKQLLAQNSIDVEAFYRQTVMEDMAVELDRVAIRGQGGAEPLGILNLASADRSTSVTFGGAATWAKVVEFETSVETSNALGLSGSGYAYLTTPATKGKWKTAPRISGAAAGFLWEGQEVNGYPARSTNQFASSPTANQVIFGQFSQVIFGEWAGIDVVVDNVTLADKHQVKVTIQKLIDMIVRQGKAFAISTDTGAA